MINAARPDISVVICSHNPRKDFLRRTLDALKSQSLEIKRWELLLVDNASIAPLSHEWDLSWHPFGRHIVEPKLGLTNARICGINAACAPLLVFLDDDNVANPDYLALAADICLRQPLVGVFGAGKIEPDFEQAPAPELTPYLRFLALRTLEDSVIKQDPSRGPVPWGAGLCVRTEVANEYARIVPHCPIRAALGRKGANLSSGEDDEFSWIARDLGFSHGMFTELQILHLIDQGRVQAPYLEKIIQGNGYSCAMLASLHGLAGQNPFAVPSLENGLRLMGQIRIRKALSEFINWIRYYRFHSSLDRRLTQARATGWRQGLDDYAKASATPRTQLTDP